MYIMYIMFALYLNVNVNNLFKLIKEILKFSILRKASAFLLHARFTVWFFNKHASKQNLEKIYLSFEKKKFYFKIKKKFQYLYNTKLRIFFFMILDKK